MNAIVQWRRKEKIFDLKWLKFFCLKKSQSMSFLTSSLPYFSSFIVNISFSSLPPLHHPISLAPFYFLFVFLFGLFIPLPIFPHYTSALQPHNNPNSQRSPWSSPNLRHTIISWKLYFCCAVLAQRGEASISALLGELPLAEQSCWRSARFMD